MTERRIEIAAPGRLADGSIGLRGATADPGAEDRGLRMNAEDEIHAAVANGLGNGSSRTVRVEVRLNGDEGEPMGTLDWPPRPDPILGLWHRARESAGTARDAIATVALTASGADGTRGLTVTMGGPAQPKPDARGAAALTLDWGNVRVTPADAAHGGRNMLYPQRPGGGRATTVHYGVLKTTDAGEPETHEEGNAPHTEGEGHGRIQRMWATVAHAAGLIDDDGTVRTDPTLIAGHDQLPAGLGMFTEYRDADGSSLARAEMVRSAPDTFEYHLWVVIGGRPTAKEVATVGAEMLEILTWTLCATVEEMTGALGNA